MAFALQFLGHPTVSLFRLQPLKSVLVNAIKSRTERAGSAAVPRCTMRNATMRRHAAGERRKLGYAATGIAPAVE
jgi:hypothetical protein